MAMAVKYVNRKGREYHLYAKEKENGKLGYYMAMKSDGILVESIPDGYEIREGPNARVYFRKVQPKIFTDEEISLIEKGIKRYSNLSDFKIETKGKSVIIYEPDQGDDWVENIASLFPPFKAKEVIKVLKDSVSYSEVMRFTLVDAKSRTFDVDRWWFSEDEWITLDSSDNLAGLVKKYCKHLGRESFYELC